MSRLNGETPKKALILNGPIRSKTLMVDELKYLRRCGPIRHWVLAAGTWFEGRANVRDYPRALYWRRKHRPQRGQCFQNAREFCLAHPNARYFEGYYLIYESPDDHAWVVMPDDKVLDFTHEAVIQHLKKEKTKVDIRPPLYLGIEIPRAQLAELHASVEANEPILTLYKEKQ